MDDWQVGEVRFPRRYQPPPWDGRGVRFDYLKASPFDDTGSALNTATAATDQDGWSLQSLYFGNGAVLTDLTQPLTLTERAGEATDKYVYEVKFQPGYTVNVDALHNGQGIDYRGRARYLVFLGRIVALHPDEDLKIVGRTVLKRLTKYNPHHDELGRFSTGDGEGGNTISSDIPGQVEGGGADLVAGMGGAGTGEVSKPLPEGYEVKSSGHNFFYIQGPDGVVGNTGGDTAAESVALYHQNIAGAATHAAPAVTITQPKTYATLDAKDLPSGYTLHETASLATGGWSVNNVNGDPVVYGNTASTALATYANTFPESMALGMEAKIDDANGKYHEYTIVDATGEVKGSGASYVDALVDAKTNGVPLGQNSIVDQMSTQANDNQPPLTPSTAGTGGQFKLTGEHLPAQFTVEPDKVSGGFQVLNPDGWSVTHGADAQQAVTAYFNGHPDDALPNGYKYLSGNVLDPSGNVVFSAFGNQPAAQVVEEFLNSPKVASGVFVSNSNTMITKPSGETAAVTPSTAGTGGPFKLTAEHLPDGWTVAPMAAGGGFQVTSPDGLEHSFGETEHEAVGHYFDAHPNEALPEGYKYVSAQYTNTIFDEKGNSVWVAPSNQSSSVTVENFLNSPKMSDGTFFSNAGVQVQVPALQPSVTPKTDTLNTEDLPSGYSVKPAPEGGYAVFHGDQQVGASMWNKDETIKEFAIDNVTTMLPSDYSFKTNLSADVPHTILNSNGDVVASGHTVTDALIDAKSKGYLAAQDFLGGTANIPDAAPKPFVPGVEHLPPGYKVEPTSGGLAWKVTGPGGDSVGVGYDQAAALQDFYQYHPSLLLPSGYNMHVDTMSDANDLHTVSITDSNGNTVYNQDHTSGYAAAVAFMSTTTGSLPFLNSAAVGDDLHDAYTLLPKGQAILSGGHGEFKIYDNDGKVVHTGVVGATATETVKEYLNVNSGVPSAASTVHAPGPTEADLPAGVHLVNVTPGEMGGAEFKVYDAQGHSVGGQTSDQALHNYFINHADVLLPTGYKIDDNQSDGLVHITGPNGLEVHVGNANDDIVTTIQDWKAKGTETTSSLGTLPETYFGPGRPGLEPLSEAGLPPGFNVSHERGRGGDESTFVGTGEVSPPSQHQVTGDEKQTIYSYTGVGNSDINRFLREDEKPDYPSEVTKRIADLDRVFADTSTAKAMTLYRGISENAQKKLDYAIAHSDGHFVDKGFLSTSSSESVAGNWKSGTYVTIEVPAGSKFLDTEHPKMLTSHPGEGEWIGARNQHFVVTKKEKSSYGYGNRTNYFIKLINAGTSKPKDTRQLDLPFVDVGPVNKQEKPYDPNEKYIWQENDIVPIHPEDIANYYRKYNTFHDNLGRFAEAGGIDDVNDTAASMDTSNTASVGGVGNTVEIPALVNSLKQFARGSTGSLRERVVVLKDGKVLADYEQELETNADMTANDLKAGSTFSNADLQDPTTGEWHAEGTIVDLHTHPRDETLSDGDWRYFARSTISEMHAVSEATDYSITKTPKFWAMPWTERTPAAIDVVHQKNLLDAEHELGYDAPDFVNRIFHEANIRTAAHFGVDYKATKLQKYNDAHDELGRFAETGSTGSSSETSSGPVPTISAEHEAAIGRYTGKNSSDINQYLRFGTQRGDPAEVSGDIKALDDVLDQNRTTAPTTVWRSIDRNMVKALGKAIDKGQGVIVDKGFTSTSRKQRFASIRDVGYVSIELPTGSPAMDVKPWSRKPEEDETLIGRNQTYHASRDPSDPHHFILKLVPNVGKTGVHLYKVRVRKDDKFTWTPSDVLFLAIKYNMFHDLLGMFSSGDSGGSTSEHGSTGSTAASETSINELINPSVLEAQREAVSDYTDEGYYDVNNYLRNDERPTYPTSTDSVIHHLDNLLSTASLPEETTVYRGISKSAAARMDEALANGNTTFVDKGFVSTTRDQHYANVFAASLKHNRATVDIILPKGSKALDIATWSSSPDEQETLVQRGSAFKLVGKTVDNDTGMTHYQARLLPNHDGPQHVEPSRLGKAQTNPAKYVWNGDDLDFITEEELYSKYNHEHGEHGYFASGPGAGLSDDEKTALHDYSTNSHSVNHYLRYGQTLEGDVPETVQKTVASLDSAFANTATKEPVMLYRGIGAHEAAMLDHARVGDGTYTDPAFISTTENEYLAEYFVPGGDVSGAPNSGYIEYRVPAGSAAIQLGDLARYHHEQSWLFDRDQTFKVDHIERVNHPQQPNKFKTKYVVNLVPSTKKYNHEHDPHSGEFASASMNEMDSAEPSGQRSDPRFSASRSLTKEEKLGVGFYTATTGYREINAALRSGFSMANTPETQAHADNLTKAIDAHTVNEPITVFRGIRNDGLINKFDQAVAAGGGEFTDKGFPSTSLSQHVALEFTSPYQDSTKYMMRITVPKGGHALPASAMGLGARDEDEVILQRGSRFRVTGRNDEGGQVVYDAELVT